MNRPALARIAAATLIVLLAACAAPPPPTDMLEGIRADLRALEEQTEIVELAPRALADARTAVRRAAAEGLDANERSQRVWIARKTIELARAEAFSEQARQRLQALDRERNSLLLRASRLEAEQARSAAEMALLESVATEEEMNRARAQALTAEEQRDAAALRAEQASEEAQQARRLAEAQATEIELARREAELASATAQSLQRRLEYMEYRQTDRGVVVTLGDVLFEVGETDLLASAEQTLRDVIELLESEPDKRIRIEGHTDATGPAALNLRISRERAESVRDALAALGIDPARMDAVGMGEDFPIASNETDEGRARNRRVDVIVLND
ncbi:MAG: OmpA family protein [Wenzhouxiangellaceae bacterium]|nr:OmpA family protein [Wenzhouxiangellaceae bacterium]